MNKVFIIGRMTADAELEYTSTQKAKTRFSVAVDNGKDANGNKRDADFINCVAWEKTADTISKYFRKGKPIVITGKIKTDNYTKDGVKKSYTYVLVESFEFVPELRVSDDKPDASVDASSRFSSVSDADYMPF